MTSSTSVDIESDRIGGCSATVAGVIIAILGLLAVGFFLLTGIAVSILFGAVLVVVALVYASNAFSAGALGSVLGQAQAPGLYCFAGVVFIADPAARRATPTPPPFALFCPPGPLQATPGLPSRGQPGSQWLLASGGISLLFAGLIWLGGPSSAGWATGVLLAVNLLITGLSAVLVERGPGESIVPDVPRWSQG